MPPVVPPEPPELLPEELEEPTTQREAIDAIARNSALWLLEVARPTAKQALAWRDEFAALPPEVRPETGPKKESPPQFRRTLVDYDTKEPAGTIIVDTPNRQIYLVQQGGQALRWGCAVGKDGFRWAGLADVGRKVMWPRWTPPPTAACRPAPRRWR